MAGQVRTKMKPGDTPPPSHFCRIRNRFILLCLDYTVCNRFIPLPLDCLICNRLIPLGLAEHWILARELLCLILIIDNSQEKIGQVFLPRSYFECASYDAAGRLRS